MSKYTKGPWLVVERQHPYKDGSKSHIERNIYTEWVDPQLKDNYPIACMSVGIGMDGEKAIPFVHIHEANARLISAAPDLLEALKDMTDMIDCGDEHGEGSPWHIKAKTAIAKALGEEA